MFPIIQHILYQKENVPTFFCSADAGLRVIWSLVTAILMRCGGWGIHTNEITVVGVADCQPIITTNQVGGVSGQLQGSQPIDLGSLFFTANMPNYCGMQGIAAHFLWACIKKLPHFVCSIGHIKKILPIFVAWT